MNCFYFSSITRFRDVASWASTHDHRQSHGAGLSFAHFAHDISWSLRVQDVVRQE